MAEEYSKPPIFVIERRREEKRVVANVSVEITIDGEGGPFTERTFIEDVSDLGCRFTTRAPTHQGDTVSLRVVGPGGKGLFDEAPHLYKIMWVAQNGHSSTLGARLIKGEKSLDVGSPPGASEQNHDSK